MFFFWCAEWRWNVFDALMATLSALSAVNSLLESVSGTNMSFLRSFRFIKVSRILRGLRVISFAFLFYIAFFTIAVFNILTGIFVEKALHMSDQADRAVEYMKQERDDAQDLRQICNRIDCDGNGRIAWPEFEAYMQNNADGFARLKACGLDVHDVHEFFVSLTSGQPAESVQIEDFIHHAMRLRGNATSIQVKSIASQMMRVQSEAQETMMWKLDSMTGHFREALAKLNSEIKTSRFLKADRGDREASIAF
eukprot:Skav205609  [mRNA]  locus=scaffold460:207730:211644:+ [translate_table: standard]